MGSYELLLFLHVAAAIIWLGAAFTLGMLVIRAERSGDPRELVSLAQINEWLTLRLFIPSSLAVFLLGILLVIDGPWGFDQLWILLGLGGYAVSFLTGILYLKPEGMRIEAAIKEKGPDSPEARRYIRRITAVSRLELLVLFIVVADMVAKPSTEDGWLLSAGAAVVAAAVAYGAYWYRAGVASLPETPAAASS